MNRIGLDEAYMQMAEIWALRSYATRNKVGALLVKDKQIISDGYNGMPPGMDNSLVELPDGNGGLITNPLVIHAEMNVFRKLLRGSPAGSNPATHGATMYVTLCPCIYCTGEIIANKVAEVVYRNTYRIPDGIQVLQDAGIIVRQLTGKP